MSRMTYEQARKDMEYLETFCELDDWVSVEDEMINFMRNPNKKKATSLYESAVGLWFQERRLQGWPEMDGPERRIVSQIAERHGAEPPTGGGEG